MDRSISSLMRRQAFVARRDQLQVLGITRDRVRSNIRAGRWQSVGSIVVVMHNAPLDREQREWAAVLTAGRDAALAGRTALAAAGLRRWEDERVHVLVPRGRTPARIDGLGIVVHETRWPADGRFRTTGSPRRTCVERATIDAVSWTKDARSSCGLVAAVVQQRLSTAGRLLGMVGEAGVFRHRALIKVALTDIAGGAEALSEIDFVRLCRKYRLGRVLHQAVRVDASGRRRYLDADIEGPTGSVVSCEVDGAIHLVATSYWADMSRSNELLISGTRTLRFPSIAFVLEEEVVADQVRRALLAEDANRAA